MSTIEDYIQVGTDIYKKSFKPSIKGGFDEILIKWKLETLKREFKDDFHQIRWFDGFCNVPDHIDYQESVGKQSKRPYYNKYFKLSTRPVKGEIKNTLNFLKHVFGDQLDIALDYLHLLYMHPNQMLPALCLVSHEKNTGKSTYLKWVKAIFERNVVYMENGALLKSFNSHWTEKLLLLFEEAKFTRVEEIDLIKNLITNDTFSTELKGIDRIESSFFGKFVICSNHEKDFIRIDPDETRFWIRKIPKLQHFDPFFTEKLIKEIPAFIHFLLNHKLKFKNESRHYFNFDVYKTNALKEVIKSSKPDLEIEMASVLIQACENLSLKRVQFTSKDLEILIGKSRTWGATAIRKILKNKWKIKPEENSLTYQKVNLWSDGTFQTLDSTGRFYTIKLEFFKANFEELMN
jgi:hypothetical protein